MKKIYANFRHTYFNKGNWRYSPSYIAKQQFSDYEGIINIVDNIIPENRYTKVNANWMKNLTRFMYYELPDEIDIDEFIKSVNLVGGQNAISIIPTADEAIEDVKNRTDLEEVEEGKFLIRDAYTDEEGVEHEAKYLIID